METVAAADATVDRLISRMVGHEIDSLYGRAAESAARRAIALDVERLSSGKAVQDVSFKVQQGEIVGFAGLPDAGRDELVECLFGLRPMDAGTITVGGRPVRISSPMAAIRQGLALVPADRRRTGALLEMDVSQNVAASSLSSVSRAGIMISSAVRGSGPEILKEPGYPGCEPDAAPGDVERRQPAENHPGAGVGHPSGGVVAARADAWH